MTLHITPEIGISAEIPSNSNYLDLRERAEAACNTATMLAEHGLDIEASIQMSLRCANFHVNPCMSCYDTPDT